MGIKQFWSSTALAHHYRAIKAAPKETLYNRWLILSVLLYSMGGIPLTWDQATSATAPSLPSFGAQFGLGAGTSALKIRNYISIVFLGAGVGAGSSFFLNDRIGRLWSLRLYAMVWILGQMIAVSAPNLAALYASRIVSGLGMGALTVVCPIAIAEISPPEIRGLLTSWFNIALGVAATTGAFCVLGVYEHVKPTRLQYQIVWFAPSIYIGVCLLASFFLCESPRWLFLVNRTEEASSTLAKLRGLPVSHPLVEKEIEEIKSAIERERSDNSAGLLGIVKETFLVRANVRRVQQTIITYGLAQLSGANSITSYFIPILKIVGIGGDTARNQFLSAMYTFAKLCFAILTSFFFVDALGRRRSLFIGTTLQMISDIYLGVYIKFHQQGSVSPAASNGAIAFIFIHGYAYTVGLYILPYIFGAELWPNRIRSFGAALSSAFHWLFIFAMAYGSPSLLAQTHNWGAFLFFAGWCLLAGLYVYFMVPETAGLSIEQIEDLFKGPWFNAYRQTEKSVAQDVEDAEAPSDKTSCVEHSEGAKASM